MQCLQLTRGEPPAITTPVAVTITGSGDSSYCYATINGTKLYSAGTHEVKAGDTIAFSITGFIMTEGFIKIDGTTVVSSTTSQLQTYDWTVPNDISTVKIALEYSSYAGKITVTTA